MTLPLWVAFAVALLLQAGSVPGGRTQAGNMAAVLKGERDECAFLLGLCRDANRSAVPTASQPPAHDLPSFHQQREAQMRCRDAVAAAQVIERKHGANRPPCLDDPVCAFTRRADPCR